MTPLFHAIALLMIGFAVRGVASVFLEDWPNKYYHYIMQDIALIFYYGTAILFFVGAVLTLWLA